MASPGRKNYYLAGIGCALLASFILFISMIPKGSLDLRPINQAAMMRTGKPINLPHYETKKRDDSLVEFGYSIELTGDAAELLKTPLDKNSLVPAHGLLFMQILNGGDFYLNDVWVAGLPKSTTTKRWQWYRPMLIPLPPKLLHSGGQPNIIKVRQSTHEPYIFIARPYIGAMFDLSLVYEVTMFLSSTLANASNLFCLVVGVFLICAWIVAPKDKVFGFAGGTSMLWAVLFTLALWTYMPLNMHKLWRWSVFLATGGVVTVISMFILSFIDEPFNKIFTRIMVGFASIAPIVYGIGGSQTESFLDVFWTGPLLLAFAYACMRLAFYCFRVKSTLSIVFLINLIITLILAVHDYGVVTGGLTFLASADQEWGWSSLFLESIYLTHLGFPFLLLIMGYILLGQYRSHVHSVENSNVHLQNCLSERELELSLSHEYQKKVERLDAARLERERIYQDVHDGLGSRLVTTVFSIRRGNAKPSDIEIQLLDCMADLRMVINAENDRNCDMQTAIFDYCSNQEFLLQSDTFSLSYDICHGPGIYFSLQNHLNVLRILQEAMTNIIKHAKASEIRIKLEQTETYLTLCISDDGQGLIASSGDSTQLNFGLSGGNGLTGMAARAKATGGEFSLKRVGNWTIAQLQIPLLGNIVT
jgi:signal transduction histidine kinase